MSKTPLLSIRCPLDLLTAIEKEVDETNRSKTDVVVDRLRQSVPSVLLRERASLPECAAVYFVFTASNRVLYVGRSVNLKQRWQGHHRFGQLLEIDADARIGWLAVDPDSLPQVESSLIDWAEPELNGTEVLGDAMTGTKLATFRIDAGVWDEFVALAKKEGSTATAELTAFIKSCNGSGQIATSRRIDTDLDKDIDARIDKAVSAAIAPLLEEIEAVKKPLAL